MSTSAWAGAPAISPGPANSRRMNMPHPGRSPRGFSLIEVLIATGLLTTVAVGTAQLVIIGAKANLMGRSQTSTTILAAQKVEQLRSLTWGFDDQQSDSAVPVSDTTSDISVDPPNAAGGGLAPSPPGVLDVSTPPFVDFLDASGRWVGTGAVPPPGTTFVRRWAIEPLPADPENTLIFRVRVTTLRRELLKPPVQAPGRLPEESSLVTVKTRKSR